MASYASDECIPFPCFVGGMGWHVLRAACSRRRYPAVKVVIMNCEQDAERWPSMRGSRVLLESYTPSIASRHFGPKLKSGCGSFTGTSRNELSSLCFRIWRVSLDFRAISCFPAKMIMIADGVLFGNTAIIVSVDGRGGRSRWLQNATHLVASNI
jgi:hypothetical protein